MFAEPNDELTAALIAVEAYLDAERPVADHPATALRSGWHDATKLSVQRVQPASIRTSPRWNTIERIRRATGGTSGITGL